MKYLIKTEHDFGNEVYVIQVPRLWFSLFKCGNKSIKDEQYQGRSETCGY